ncbi:ferritin-like domain-containing protein [Rhizobium leguminosarum]|nr:ferritin-like domain-containing protein [Rhizobium leguminosarum]
MTVISAIDAERRLVGVAHPTSWNVEADRRNAKKSPALVKTGQVWIAAGRTLKCKVAAISNLSTTRLLTVRGAKLFPSERYLIGLAAGHVIQVFFIILLNPPACRPGTARGKTCEAIQGIIAEVQEIMEEYNGTVALDAGLISSAQGVEHYEIARDGTLFAWAKQLGLKDAVPLLQANLAEEEVTDQKLTQLAEASANVKGNKAARSQPEWKTALDERPFLRLARTCHPTRIGSGAPNDVHPPRSRNASASLRR